MRLGLKTPALYRLMFGSAAAEAGAALEPIIRRRDRPDAFAVSPDTSKDLALAMFSVCSDGRLDDADHRSPDELCGPGVMGQNISRNRVFMILPVAVCGMSSM